MTTLTATSNSKLTWRARFKALFTGKLFIKTTIEVYQDNIQIKKTIVEVHVGEKPRMTHVGVGASTEAGGMNIAE